MEKLVAVAGLTMVTLALLFFIGIMGGTIFYWLYPNFQHVFGLPNLSWGECVSIVWCAHLLQRDNKATLKKD